MKKNLKRKRRAKKTVATTTGTHHGNNLKHYRRMNNLTQKEFAKKLGEPWSQRKLMYLESKRTISPEILQDLATALNVSVEKIQYFDADKIIKSSPAPESPQSVKFPAAEHDEIDLLRQVDTGLQLMDKDARSRTFNFLRSKYRDNWPTETY